MWYFDELTESGNRKTFKRQKGLNVKRSFPRCPRPWPFVPLNLSNSLIQCHNLLLLGDTYMCVSLIPRLKEITLVPTKPPTLLYQP